MGFLDEISEHFLGYLEIRDHPVLHGPDGGDVAGCAPQHLLGLFADRLDFLRDVIDGNDGRLGNNDTSIFRVDQRVRGPEIDGERVGHESKNRAKVHPTPTLICTVEYQSF